MISVQGRSTLLVNQANGSFSFPVTSDQFRLDSVKKKGYQLVDMEACPRTYKYSSNPLYIVMETPDQQLQDQLTAERKIRRNLQKQLQEREDEIESLKEQQQISDEEYRAALQKLYQEQENNEQLIKDMAKRKRFKMSVPNWRKPKPSNKQTLRKPQDGAIAILKPSKLST